MTSAFTRIGLGMGAAAVAMMLLGPGQQNISAQGPGFGGGRFGGPGGPGGPMGRGGPGLAGPVPLNRLGLTDDQRSRVRQVMQSHREDQRALAERARTAHQALQDVLASPTFDEAAIRARSADVASVQADMAVLQGRVFGEIYQILTPEQQQKLAELRTQQQERMKQLQQRRQNRAAGQP
ncbi:MAG: Spy/CpxP family protein refolding chaperone [Vicinamibacterales bacterium]